MNINAKSNGGGLELELGRENEEVMSYEKAKSNNLTIDNAAIVVGTLMPFLSVQ